MCTASHLIRVCLSLLSLMIASVTAATATTTNIPFLSTTSKVISHALQPILQPNSSSIITPGTTFYITWKPDTRFENVTLELWDRTGWGYSRDFGSLCYHYINPFCGNIHRHIPNTGNFSWPIPVPQNGFPRNNREFWIKMYVNDFYKPEEGNTMPVVSFSESFAFGSTNGVGWVSSTPPAWKTRVWPTATISMVDSPASVSSKDQDQPLATYTTHPSKIAGATATAAAGRGDSEGLKKTSGGSQRSIYKSWKTTFALLLGLL